MNLRDYYVSDHVIPSSPSLPADHILRWGRIKVSVGKPALLFSKIVEEVFGARLDQRIIIMAAYLKRVDCGSRTGKSSAATRLIGKSSLFLPVAA